MDRKQILTWGGFILGMAVLLVGLAKLGSNSNTGGGEVGSNLSVAVSDSDWSKGSKTATHTIVEYSDFQCPACGAYAPLLKRLADEHPNDVRLVYRHFPLDQVHPNARAAAWAAEAAGMQGKFFEMHDALFNTQETWSADASPEIFFEDLAHSLGMDSGKFKTDMKSQAVKDKVTTLAASGSSSGVNSTPSLFLDGKLITNPSSYEELVGLVTTAVTK